MTNNIYLSEMELDEKIKKISGYKTWSAKKKVDNLLEIDAHMYCNLGKESTITQKKEVKKMSRKIYRAIASISPLDGYNLEAHMNEKDLSNAS